jgi:2-octaprenyl-6-methoxyphenol hydroxylase
VTDAAEVVIVGGGPVGAVLALKLASAGCATVVLEPRAAFSGPLRPVALSYGSRLLLERLAAWAPLAPATLINRIHVSQRGGFGRAVLTAQDVGLPALGYVVDYGRMHAALTELLAQRRSVRILRATVTRLVPGADEACVEYSDGSASGSARARLVVVADGGAMADDARSRLVDYGQTAVVATVTTERAHCNTAFERFTASGPLALLPWQERYALIWSVRSEHAQQLCDMTEAAFAGEAERAFGRRLGAFGGGTQRAAFPLVLRVTGDSTLGRVVRIGNAAQMLHPVAGQGLNLGLRDAWELADDIVRTRGDCGSATVLSAFRARRRLDRNASISLTDALVRGFSNDSRALRAARGLGLTLLGCVPPARDLLVRGMTFGFRV